MNTIQIIDRSIKVKEYQDQRVVTFKDIDYIHLTIENAKCTNFVHSNIPPKGQYLFTKSIL